METNFNTQLKCEDCCFKIEMNLEGKETLIMKITNQIGLYPIIYKKSYSIKDLQDISNYFLNISLDEIPAKINTLITSEKYTLKRDYLNPSNLILNLYPSLLDLSGDDIKEIKLDIPLEKNEINLYEIIADMSFKINELNEKVKKLENEQTPKKQMIESAETARDPHRIQRLSRKTPRKKQ